MINKNDISEKEIIKLRSKNNNLKEELRANENKFRGEARKSELDINTLKKAMKIKEKEAYNLNSRLDNCQDTIHNLKSELASLKSSKSKVEKEVKRFEQQLKKLEVKKPLKSTGSQTISTVDIPYAVTDPLPPIFGSKLCRRTNPIFLSKSLPDLSRVLWVAISEEDILLENAEEALSELYDREVAAFYSDAKSEAAAARCLKDQTERNFLDLGQAKKKEQD